MGPPCLACLPHPQLLLPSVLQRHMVDTNRCKMAYDDNEEEYEVCGCCQ